MCDMPVAAPHSQQKCCSHTRCHDSDAHNVLVHRCIHDWRVWCWVATSAARGSTKSTWPQRQVTWLQPELFSTGHWHLGHGLVLAVIQVLFSLSPDVFSSHMRQLQMHSILWRVHQALALAGSARWAGSNQGCEMPARQVQVGYVVLEAAHVAGAGAVRCLAAGEAELQAAVAGGLAVWLAVHLHRPATVRHAGAPVYAAQT